MFDEGGTFSHKITEDGRVRASMCRNAIIFGVDMSSSIRATNRANYIYVMGEGLVQGIHGNMLYAEKQYWRNFTDPGKNL